MTFKDCVSEATQIGILYGDRSGLLRYDTPHERSK